MEWMRAHERLYRRVASMVGFGRITATDDGGTVHKAQIQLGQDEFRDATPVAMMYGFHSHATPGSDVTVVFVGGDRSNGVAIATGDQRCRPTGSAPGEVGVYDNQGVSIFLRRGGIEIRGGGLPISISDSPTVTITADLAVVGNITATGEVTAKHGGAAVALSPHTHTDSKGGTTSVPKPTPGG